MKHLGKLKNTNQRCAVVYRNIPGPDGRGVSNPDKCLIVLLENLPDHIREEIENIIRSPSTQQTKNLYDAFRKERFQFNSENVLQYFSNPQTGRMISADVNNVVMLPERNVEIELWKLNRIIELQERGHSEAQVGEILLKEEQKRNLDHHRKAAGPQEPPAQEAAPQAQAQAPKPAAPPLRAKPNEVLDNKTIADNYRAQAKMHDNEAAEYRRKADELDPQPQMESAPAAPSEGGSGDGSSFREGGQAAPEAAHDAG